MNASALLRFAPLVALLFVSLPSNAQDWAWIDGSGGSGADSATGIVVDADGNSYVVGSFRGTATFGPTTLTSAGGDDAFIVKYSPEGEVLWVRSGSGPRDVFGRAVAIGTDGNIYVNGFFWGTATFGPFSITSEGTQDDLLLVKYTPEGEVLWAQRQGGRLGDSSAAAAVLPSGDLYIAGRFNGTSTFGSFTLSSVANTTDCLLLKYTPDGEVLWARSGGGPSTDKFYGAATDADGNAYAVGFFKETAAFGPFILTSVGGVERDAVIAKYAPDGEVLWAHSVGGEGDDFALATDMDAAGNLYVLGSFEGTAAFGNTTLTGSGELDLFVAKYTSEGDLIWVRGGGGGGTEIGRALAVDDEGHAFVTGRFEDVATFGSSALSSAGDTDVLLMKLSPEGEVLWAQDGGGEGRDIGTGIALASDGTARMAGFFAWAGTFGPYTLASAGGDDVFVAEIGSAPPVAVLVAPADPPVVIPAEGGAFAFTVTLTNTTGEPQTFEVWTAASGPRTREPVFGPRTLTLAPGATLTQTLTQQVPAIAPEGTYAFHVRVGEYPSPRAENAFAFVKEAGARVVVEGDGGGWRTSGWESTGAAAPSAAAGLPGGYALSSPRPNPFARQARFSLEVAEAQHVTAEVLDALGRRVALLHDGSVAAGVARALVLDAAALPAGLYVVRVTGERFVATRRVALVR